MISKYPPVTLPRTEVRNVRSAHGAQDYKLFVRLPQDYATSTAVYPVLYVLDANWIFGTVAPVGDWLHLETHTAPLITVGIGYPTDDFDEQIVLRTRDFTPTRDLAYETLCRREMGMEMFTTGGADDFLCFIRDELFPFMAAEYRVDPQDRTLLGYSFGGLFGLHTLLTQPDSFQRYVLCSPDLEWDSRVIFATECACAAERTDLPVRLFLTAGSLEERVIEPTVSSLYRMAALLKNRNYPGLALTLVLFEGETHSSIVSASVARGLRSVFQP